MNFRTITIAALAVTALAACGGDSDEPADPTTLATTPATVTGLAAYVEMSCPDGTVFRISDDGWWLLDDETVRPDPNTSEERGGWSVAEVCDQL